MANLNKVMLMGNLTRDPELRYLQSGTAVCDFGMAINRRWKSSSGEQKEEVCFVDVTAFGRQAEVVSEYLQKGRPVFVEGRLRLEQWTSQDGQKRSKLSVVLEGFQFLDSRGSQGGGGQQGGHQQRQAPRPPRQQGGPRPQNAPPRPVGGPQPQGADDNPPAQDDFDNVDDSIPF